MNIEEFVKRFNKLDIDKKVSFFKELRLFINYDTIKIFINFITSLSFEDEVNFFNKIFNYEENNDDNKTMDNGVIDFISRREYIKRRR